MTLHDLMKQTASLEFRVTYLEKVLGLICTKGKPELTAVECQRLETEAQKVVAEKYPAYGIKFRHGSP